MTEEENAAERLHAFIRSKVSGGCRVLSQGWPDGPDGCKCPLCDVTRLLDAAMAKKTA